MRIFRTTQGILIESFGKYYLHQVEWDSFLNFDGLRHILEQLISRMDEFPEANDLLETELLCPVGGRELWASGVTYVSSKFARMEEAKRYGGGDFYERVYHADRPELFFKNNGFRVRGHGQEVRIRSDSNWNVPEPELTLAINSRGEIYGYTIGNDMSSREIEGENPLYLPQAKSYTGSAAVGPGIFLPEKRIAQETGIGMSIYREEKIVFEGKTKLIAMKRSMEELAAWLFRELDFPQGCFLMTGTGIIPPDDFSLKAGDEIEINIDEIGTLKNRVSDI